MTLPAGAEARADRPARTGDPAAEARDDFLRISTSPNSTERSIELFRLLADPFKSGTLALAADRLAGEARRPGPKPCPDDRELLALVKERKPFLGTAAIGAIVRAKYPLDLRRQQAAVQRLRRKLREEKRTG